MLLLVPALVPRAQEDPVSQPGAAPLYEIEIIAFRYLDQQGNTPETQINAAGPATGTALQPDAGAEAAQIPPSPAAGATYAPLAAQALRLSGIAARLGRAGPYRLLYHGGWTQPVERQERARPTPLPPEALLTGDIGGAITLYRERYLHVLVDVALAGPAPAPRIHQGRRLRGQSLQYFDHPEFGVILAVRQISGATGPATPDDTPAAEQ